MDRSKKRNNKKSLTTTKEKECCATDTDVNVSTNNRIINNKGSYSNKDINNISKVKNSKEMNINNNGFKINDNKSDNNNNLDIENNISNNISSKYGRNIKVKNIGNKCKGHKII